MLSKTPFSATILLKSSFVKRFSEDGKLVKKLEESAEIDREKLKKGKVKVQLAYVNDKRKSENS